MLCVVAFDFRVALGGLILLLMVPRHVLAESSWPDGGHDDAGCVGGDQPLTCENHADCAWNARCTDGACLCRIACPSDGYRENCDAEGCWCEAREACAYNDDCTEGFCVDSYCREDFLVCDGALHETACDDGGCRCAHRPMCLWHHECGEGVLCVERQCTQGSETCDEIEGMRAVCWGERCRCELTEGSVCTDHNDCGALRCVINRCRRLASCESARLVERCTPWGCRCYRPEQADAAVPGAAAPDAAVEDGAVGGASSTSGCGCSVGARAPRGAAYGLIGMALLVVRRRKRRSGKA